jgi:hypothetical protein
MKKIDELKTKISEANERINELKEQVQKELQVEFNGALAELFDAYPFVKSVSFAAYTPFFNDGDSCTYSANHEYCDFNGYGEYDDEGEGENILQLAKENIYVNVGGSYKQQPNPDFNPLYKEAVDAFREALAIVDEDNWEEMVGDHVKVTITREGITTDEYEHD